MTERKLFLRGLLVLMFLVGLAVPILAEEAQGRIATVNPEKNQVVLTESLKNWTFLLSKDGRVLLNDQESRLSELRPGDNATVTFTRQGEQLRASSVRAVRK